MNMTNAQQALQTAGLAFLGIGAWFDLRKRALPSGRAFFLFFRDFFSSAWCLRHAGGSARETGF